MEKTRTVIDLSKWNTVSSYEKMAAEIDGVILRIGYRAKATGKITLDPSYKTHFDAFKKTGTPTGVYFFTTAITEKEAEEEAEWVIHKIKREGLAVAFPIAVDTEYSDNSKSGRADNLSKEQRTKCVIAFCERCKKLGYKPMIYASDSWFVSHLDYEKVKGYQKWVARYGGKKPERAVDNVVGWQKTDAYKVSGTPKGVDMSEWYTPISIGYGIMGGPVETTKKETPVKEEVTSKQDASLHGGDMVYLDQTPLYSTATTDKTNRLFTGKHFCWDGAPKNGRIRITTKKEYVGVMGKVTGWVCIADIKKM